MINAPYSHVYQHYQYIVNRRVCFYSLCDDSTLPKMYIHIQIGSSLSIHPEESHIKFTRSQNWAKPRVLSHPDYL